MKLRTLTGLGAVLVLLTACAGRPSSDQAATSSGSNDRSGVQFYGTLDTGVGIQHMSR